MEGHILADLGNTSFRFLYRKDGENKVVKAMDGQKIPAFLTEVLKDFQNEEKPLLFVSSVNSYKADILSKACRKKGVDVIFLKPSEIAGRVNEMGFKIPNLEVLGADLLFDILAVEKDGLVADYGTASKILLVKDREFLGGLIGPGLAMMNHSLFVGTDLLGNYLPQVPHDFYSFDTEEAVNANGTYGEGLKLMGLYEKTKKTYDFSLLPVYITGGDGALIKKSLTYMGSDLGQEDPLFIFKGMAKALKIYDEFFKENKGE